MNYEHVLVEQSGPVTIVTLNRPNVMNALNAAANEELQQIFDRFIEDPDQWVAIVTGSGKAFCAGHDLRQQSTENGLKPSPTGFAGLTGRTSMTKPVIAAVNGVAMGGGFELALSCDIVVAAQTAKFALPEPRVGLAALGGGMLRLPRSIGFHRAMGMLLTGRTVSAAEGETLGFVNEVTERPVVEAALEWAKQIIACSPMSVRATKEATLRGYDEELARSMAHQWSYPAMAALLSSEDMVEGPKAFTEQRQPQWLGR